MALNKSPSHTTGVGYCWHLMYDQSFNSRLTKKTNYLQVLKTDRFNTQLEIVFTYDKQWKSFTTSVIVCHKYRLCPQQCYGICVPRAMVRRLDWVHGHRQANRHWGKVDAITIHYDVSQSFLGFLSQYSRWESAIHSFAMGNTTA